MFFLCLNLQVYFLLYNIFSCWLVVSPSLYLALQVCFCLCPTHGFNRPNPTHVGWVGLMWWVEFFFNLPWWVGSKNPLNQIHAHPYLGVLSPYHYQHQHQHQHLISVSVLLPSLKYSFFFGALLHFIIISFHKSYMMFFFFFFLEKVNILYSL